MKITLTKKDYDNLLDAWSKMNILCAYIESPELFTQKYKIKEQAKEIYIHLDKVVAKLPD